jgi:hypothetical protein
MPLAFVLKKDIIFDPHLILLKEAILARGFF